MSITDVVALSERYAELLQAKRAATTPVEEVRIRLEMVQIRLALIGSQMEFYL